MTASADLWSQRSRPIGSGSLAALEILVLGALAAYLVLGIIPSAFSIESDCIGPSGVRRITGDTYFAAAAVVGTFGWLAVAAAAICAQISESRRLALFLPFVWFLVFVGGALAVAATIGPQVCPS